MTKTLTTLAMTLCLLIGILQLPCYHADLIEHPSNNSTSTDNDANTNTVTASSTSTTTTTDKTSTDTIDTIDTADTGIQVIDAKIEKVEIENNNENNNNIIGPTTKMKHNGSGNVEVARKRWKRIFEEIKSFDLAERRKEKVDGTNFFNQWKLYLDGGGGNGSGSGNGSGPGTKNYNNGLSNTNTTALMMRQRFDDGFSTWEKKLQQWADDVAEYLVEENIKSKAKNTKNETSTTLPSLMPSLTFAPTTAKDGEAILPHTDISDKSKNIWIVTTAALPWMTGTAVNPLLRAAYMTDGRAEAGGSITLMIPWLELVSDRESIYGKDRVFESPEAQEEWIRTWLRETADMKQASEELNIRWYTGRVEKLENSIYSMGDITALLPVRFFGLWM